MRTAPCLDPEPEEQPQGRRRLLGLVALLLASAAALYALAGPPHPPSRLPAWGEVGAVLRGSTLPLDALAYGLVTLAWLLWLWLLGSLALELLVVGAAIVGRGATWVRQLRAVADRVSLPIARRAVAAAFVVQMVGRAVPAAAAPLTPTDTALLAEAEDSRPVSPVAWQERQAAHSGVEYTVRPGDTLWTIAQRFFGAGDEYRRLVEANLGRRMPDGRTFTAQGVIQPGWVLDVPVPSPAVRQVEGQRWYTVEPGDTLAGIAAREIGDPARWPDLFDLNRGTARLADGPALTDPDLIWPGLLLRLPPEAEPAAVAPEPEPELAAAAEPTRDEPAPAPPARSALMLDAQVVDPAPVPTPSATVEPLPAADPDPVDDGQAVVLTQASEPAAPSPTPIPPLPLAAGVAGLALVAAGASLGARRLLRPRRPRDEPESEVVVQGGYAEAEPARELVHRLQGGERDQVVILVAQLQRFLREHGLADAPVIAARAGRTATTLTLAAPLAAQARLLELAPAFGQRLGASAEARLSRDQDVLLRLTGLRGTRLPPPTTGHAAPSLLPIGALYSREILYVDWSALGHTLIASLPGAGAETILTSLLAALTARRRPDELRLWTIAGQRSLPAPLGRLPHQLTAPVDPRDPDTTRAVLDQVRAELDRRLRRAEPPSAPGADPELVVVLGELASVQEWAPALELLGTHGPACGMRLLAATSDPEGLRSPLLPHFATRLVLQTADEDASVALLGLRDAAFLGGGGRLLLRIDGREPVELYGYHVTTEHLERLVSLMGHAYGAATSARPPGPRAEGAPTEPSHPPAATRAAAPGEGGAMAEGGAGPAAPVAGESRPVVPHEVTRLALPGAEAPVASHTAPSEPGVAERSNGHQPSLTGSSAPPPPIEAVCFGGPRVLHAGAQIWPSLASADAKPWEVLLFLACQPPAGATRDTLAQALWPDDDSNTDPGHRLRQLRYRLRGALERLIPGLSGDVVRPETGGVYRLDPAVATSDVHRFLALERAARALRGSDAIAAHEQARALYAGDLLGGPDGRRYAWVDERGDSGVTLREHYRRLYHQLTGSLADLYAEAGQTDGALALYRELARADPGDERFWRALFRLHHRRGDRPGLLREERRLRQALRELDADDELAEDQGLYEPSPETAREFQRLLADLAGGQRARSGA